MSEAELSIADDFPQGSYRAWRERVEREHGGSLDPLRRATPDGLAIEPLYTRESAPREEAIGFPGVPPFVRGRLPAGRPSGGWDVCAEHDHPSSVAAAEAVRRDMERGATSLWLRLGIDHGTRVLTGGDLAHLLEAVDLRSVRVVLEPGMDPIPLAATFAAVARAREVELAELRGSYGVDPLGHLARCGSLYSGTGGSSRELAELFAWSREHTPAMGVMLASGLPYQEAGATAVQELAFTVATALEYLDGLTEAGHPVDDVAPRILFAFGVGHDLFVEMAKLRAARLLWSKIVTASGGAEASRAMWLHARTAHQTKSRRDPWVNMARTTAEAFAAVAGGADSVTVGPFDEALGPSDEMARRLARNTQLILREEAHLHRVADPGGGSWFLESMTDALARSAWLRLRQLVAEGGMGRALRVGKVRSAIRGSVERRRRELGERSLPVVGVSAFPDLEERPLERPWPDPGDVEDHVGRSFGQGDVRKRYEALLEFAKVVAGKTRVAPGEAMAAAVEAASLGVDLFNLGSVLRSGKPSVHIEPLHPERHAEPWERLRDASEMFARIRGRRPRALVLGLGSPAEHRGRSELAAQLLAVGGIEPVRGAVDDTAAAEQAFAEADADVAVICGTDERYAESVPSLVSSLRKGGAACVILAGDPGPNAHDYRAAGVRAFLHEGADVLSVLQAVHDEVGVSP